MTAAYAVEPESPPCNECGRDNGFVVVGPDGIALGITFDIVDDAEDLADHLNAAYELGRAAERAGV
jgi:hypothetical protein